MLAINRFFSFAQLRCGCHILQHTNNNNKRDGKLSAIRTPPYLHPSDPPHLVECVHLLAPSSTWLFTLHKFLLVKKWLNKLFFFFDVQTFILFMLINIFYCVTSTVASIHQQQKRWLSHIFHIPCHFMSFCKVFLFLDLNMFHLQNFHTGFHSFPIFHSFFFVLFLPRNNFT